TNDQQRQARGSATGSSSDRRSLAHPRELEYLDLVGLQPDRKALVEDVAAVLRAAPQRSLWIEPEQVPDLGVGVGLALQPGPYPPAGIRRAGYPVAAVQVVEAQQWRIGGVCAGTGERQQAIGPGARPPP